MRKIESVNNEYVKELAKLKSKKYRDAKKMFLVEGYHLVNEAKEKLVEVLIVDEKDKIDGIENILVNKEIIKKISTTAPVPVTEKSWWISAFAIASRSIAPVDIVGILAASAM